MCASEATASPPFSRSPWALRGCMTRPPPVRLGGPVSLRNGSRLPVSVGPLHQPDQVLGHPAVLRLRRRAPDQRSSPRGSIARSRNRSSMAASTATSRSCGTPSAWLRRTVQCPVARREERLPEPRSGPSGVGPRDVTQARRMRQTCVQGTGCDTALRGLARRSGDPRQVRRLLALAAAYDGRSRTEAAMVGGMDRQTLRDWAHRFNEEGPDDLKHRCGAGRPRLLMHEQMSELSVIVEIGPDPEVDGVVRWRRIDLKRVIGLAPKKWRAPTETGGVRWDEGSGLRRSSSARRCAWL